MKKLHGFLTNHCLWIELGLLVAFVLVLIILIIVSVKFKRSIRDNMSLASTLAKRASDAEEQSAKNFEELTHTQRQLELEVKKISELKETESCLMEKNANLNNEVQISKGEYELLEEELKTTKETLKLANESIENLKEQLSSLEKQRAEDELKYEQVNSENVVLRENMDKLVEECDLRVKNVEAELEVQKKVSDAFAVAVKQISQPQPAPVIKKPAPKKRKVDLSKKFEDMNRDELLLAARNFGLKGIYRKSKAELVELLNQKLLEK